MQYVHMHHMHMMTHVLELRAGRVELVSLTRPETKAELRLIMIGRETFIVRVTLQSSEACSAYMYHSLLKCCQKHTLIRIRYSCSQVAIIWMSHRRMKRALNAHPPRYEFGDAKNRSAADAAFALSSLRAGESSLLTCSCNSCEALSHPLVYWIASEINC